MILKGLIQFHFDAPHRSELGSPSKASELDFKILQTLNKQVYIETIGHQLWETIGHEIWEAMRHRLWETMRYDQSNITGLSYSDTALDALPQRREKLMRGVGRSQTPNLQGG